MTAQILTNLIVISFPDYDAGLRVGVPGAHMSSVCARKQKGVHVVAKSCKLHIPNLCRRSHPLDLHKQIKM